MFPTTFEMNVPQDDVANGSSSDSETSAKALKMNERIHGSLEQVTEDRSIEISEEPIDIAERPIAGAEKAIEIQAMRIAIDGLAPANSRMLSNLSPSSTRNAPQTSNSVQMTPKSTMRSQTHLGLPSNDTIRKRVRGDFFDPFRHQGQRPSSAQPIALEKTLSIRTKFPVIFDPDYFYHSQSAEAAQQVDQYVHYCNIVKSLMQGGSVLMFGAMHLVWMTLFPDSPEKWWAIEFMTLWTIYAILILKAVRPQKNHYLYRILTQVLTVQFYYND